MKNPLVAVLILAIAVTFFAAGYGVGGGVRRVESEAQFKTFASRMRAIAAEQKTEMQTLLKQQATQVAELEKALADQKAAAAYFADDNVNLEDHLRLRKAQVERLQAQVEMLQAQIDHLNEALGPPPEVDDGSREL